MDDYKLDFGRLAYIKTEDLSSRINAIETKSSENNTVIYFRRENIDASVSASFSQTFVCEAGDAIINAGISANGLCEVTFLLDGVFLYSQQAEGSGERSLSFEARGLSQGEKNLEVILSGSTVNYIEINISGNRMAYGEFHTCLAHTAVNGDDYVLYIADEKLALYKAEGTVLKKMLSFAGQAKYCQISKNDNKLYIFYTVWDNTLYFCEYNTATCAHTLPIPVCKDITKFSAAFSGGILKISLVSGKRVYDACGILCGAQFCFTNPQLASINNVSETALCESQGRFYLSATSTSGQAQLYVSRLHTPQSSEIFSLQLEVIKEVQ